MPSKNTSLPPEQDTLVRLPIVLGRVPVSRAAWWKGVKEGRYPAAIKLGPKTTCWRSSDIDKLIAELASAK
ncbi:AlpA family transcriptional regulator [Variovorax sp. J22R115]|uniref:helix-turn-helix transcriptional regulator n=1 Tax=Variovorax sp. J22R115 TaxID=3053509 RepID=UPI0025790536|nr:AlpA family phage regulatory protein [Variovorax sp. J22R115]MDM0053668.1 AlpA family phage regulatory protein [Variovorax sp. J22R115]